MRLFVFLLIVLFSSPAFGQIDIQEDAKVSSLMNRYELMGKEESYINGWRIKIISTTNRRSFERAESLLRSYYPNQVYVADYENPYYSIKLGAFETRFDVEPFLTKFKEDFPDAIPFRDRIMKTELFEH